MRGIKSNDRRIDMRSKKEVANLILEGLKLSYTLEQDDRFIFLKDGKVKCCAAGLAVAALFPSQDAVIDLIVKEGHLCIEYRSFAARILDCDIAVIDRIADEHLRGISATDIATLILDESEVDDEC